MMTMARQLALVIAILIAATPASARTCDQIANACIKQGGNHAICFDQDRMKRCKSTSVYTAPDGKSYPADKKK